MSAAAFVDEAALVRRIQGRARDRDAAFAELFAAYRARVFTVCRHLVRSQADAEDATQEVFVALWRALPSFRGESALGTFIHRIAVRAATRQRGRSLRAQSARVTPPEPAAGDPLESKQEEARLWAAIDRLTLEQRTVLALFAVEGLGHREISDILGIPEGTVWSRLHTARKRLAAELDASPKKE
jgi:RNA polymerase sigma-70 factor, ECF subfamily